MATVNNKPASAYAKPHTMSGGKVSLKNEGYEGGDRMTTDALNMSVGNIRNKSYKGVKTNGTVTRGNGAATKGTMARGPMA
jgi:hypothetical protein